MVTAGEIVVIGTPGGGGHITTCVAGSGSTATLVDNITYMSGGQIQNAAKDGSSNDVIVAAPHAAVQEWAGVQASSVVIYELDTPVVRATVSSHTMACLASQSLASLFTATDPAGKAIASWQIYDTSGSDRLMVGGTAYGDHSAAAVLTATSLGSVSLLAGSAPTSDTVEVRAFNGSYWGDWQSLAVTVRGATVAAPPVLAVQTQNQAWTEGRAISFVLPANTFVDPQGQKLSFTASQSNGQALPTWLAFNSATATFTGTAPGSTRSVGIKVTATDTSGLSASESFTGAVQAPVIQPGIKLTVPTPAQTWADGQTVNLALPANTFTDALNLKMSFLAYEVSGPDVTSWLHFNSTTDVLSGTGPLTATGAATLEVIASDAQHMPAMDLFGVTFVPGSGHIGPAVAAHSFGMAQHVDPSHVAALLAFHV
jgi:hypothetical protein